MEFEDKLKNAILRGQQRGQSRNLLQKQSRLSAEEIRNKHNDFRLALSEYIEHGLQSLANHFPGFRYETIYGQRGWGGAISRDDIMRGASGRGGTFFSRFEITVRPLNEFNVVNISGKGTIDNKEIFNWNHFEDIAESAIEGFQKKIDSWIFQYAEQFAAR
jgi:hypothetical protein